MYNVIWAKQKTESFVYGWLCALAIFDVTLFFMPPPFEEWWRGIKCYPCPCVRSCVRPSVIKIWCPLNNFWKTASIRFIFGMLMYNNKTQVKFDLGYNPLIFDGVMGLFKKKHSTKIGVRSKTFERVHRFDSYFACWYLISKHRSSSIWVTTPWFLTELWALYKNIAQKLVSAQ